MSPNNGSSPLFSRKLQLQTGNTSTIFKLSVVATAAILSQSAAAQNPANVEDADNSIELKDTYVRPDYVEIERMRDTKEIIVIPKEALQKPLFPSRIEQNRSVRFFFTTSKNGVFFAIKIV